MSGEAGLLTTETVGAYVEGIKVLEGPCEVEEITGGNLNYAWRVKGATDKSVFVKQAPEFIKCLGKDFGLTATRMAREVEALKALRRVSEAHAPEVLHFDASKCVAIMEDLRGFRLLRDDLLDGTIDPAIAGDLGKFLTKVRAETRGVARLIGDDNNAAMRAITRDFVFTKAFIQDPTNRELTDPTLMTKAHNLKQDAHFLQAVAAARSRFDDDRDCLSHGDLHAGSVMTDGVRAVAIDAEFAFLGPAEFDPALLAAGYCFTYFSADAWSVTGDGSVNRRKSKLALAALLDNSTGVDLPKLAAFTACELARRVLGAASVPDLSGISAPDIRARIESALLDYATTLLTRPPQSPIDLLAALDDTYDASLHFTASSSSST